MGQFHKSALQITCYLECAYLLRSLLIQAQHVRTYTATLNNVMLLLRITALIGLLLRYKKRTSKWAVVVLRRNEILPILSIRFVY